MKLGFYSLFLLPSFCLCPLSPWSHPGGGGCKRLASDPFTFCQFLSPFYFHASPRCIITLVTCIILLSYASPGCPLHPGACLFTWLRYSCLDTVYHCLLFPCFMCVCMRLLQVAFRSFITLLFLFLSLPFFATNLWCLSEFGATGFGEQRQSTRKRYHTMVLLYLFTIVVFYLFFSFDFLS